MESRRVWRTGASTVFPDPRFPEGARSVPSAESSGADSLQSVSERRFDIRLHVLEAILGSVAAGSTAGGRQTVRLQRRGCCPRPPIPTPPTSYCPAFLHRNVGRVPNGPTDLVRPAHFLVLGFYICPPIRQCTTQSNAAVAGAGLSMAAAGYFLSVPSKQRQLLKKATRATRCARSQNRLPKVLRKPPSVHALLNG